MRTKAIPVEVTGGEAGGPASERTLSVGAAVAIAKFMNGQMDLMAADEMYEAAAYCRDVAHTFGTFALGYGRYEVDVEPLLYEVLKIHGRVEGLDSRMRVIFGWLGRYFRFQLGITEFTACSNIFHVQQKTKPDRR